MEELLKKEIMKRLIKLNGSFKKMIEQASIYFRRKNIMKKFLDNKSILITGGTGSFGRRDLLKQFLKSLNQKK